MFARVYIYVEHGSWREDFSFACTAIGVLPPPKYQKPDIMWYQTQVLDSSKMIFGCLFDRDVRESALIQKYARMSCTKKVSRRLGNPVDWVQFYVSVPKGKADCLLCRTREDETTNGVCRQCFEKMSRDAINQGKAARFFLKTRRKYVDVMFEFN